MDFRKWWSKTGIWKGNQETKSGAQIEDFRRSRRCFLHGFLISSFANQHLDSKRTRTSAFWVISLPEVYSNNIQWILASREEAFVSGALGAELKSLHQSPDVILKPEWISLRSPLPRVTPAWSHLEIFFNFPILQPTFFQSERGESAALGVCDYEAEGEVSLPHC